MLCVCRAETERGLSRKHIIEGGCCASGTFLCQNSEFAARLPIGLLVVAGTVGTVPHFCIHPAVHCVPMELGVRAAAGWIRACTAVFCRWGTNRAVPMKRHISVILRISSINCEFIMVRTCRPGRLCHPHTQGMRVGESANPTEQRPALGPAAACPVLPKGKYLSVMLSCEVCTHTSHGLLALPHRSPVLTVCWGSASPPALLVSGAEWGASIEWGCCPRKHSSC